MAYINGLRLLAFSMVATVAAGCASRSDCVACGAAPHADYSPRCEVAMSALAAKTDVSQPRNFLFLSGGGSHGAWGAGFLKGWSGAGRPAAFDVVTGVSTGALQATFAFLGQSQDAKLEESYTTVEDNDIFDTRFSPLPALALLWAPSTRTTAPLERLLKERLPDDLLDQVGSAAGKRLLCVGTVDLDTGAFVAWDMTAIARQKDYARYRSIIAASTAVPLVFPPKEIVGYKGSWHVDGGVRQQVFARDLLKQFDAAMVSQFTPQEIDAARATNTAYFLVNGQLSVSSQCTAPRGISTAARSVDILLNEALFGSLFRNAYLLAHGKDGLSKKWILRFQKIPDQPTISLPSMTFQKPEMRKWFDSGQSIGAEGKWSNFEELASMSGTTGSCVDAATF